MLVERPVWKDGKKCCVMITLNLNAELFWLQLDSNCVNMPKTLSLGQYGMTRGLERVLDILEAKNIKATIFIPGWVAENYPEKAKMCADRSHEIGCLGYKHENMALLTPKEQDEAIKMGKEAIEKICKVSPKGYRSPEGELTLDTLRAAKKHGMIYSSDLNDDDLPYRLDLKNGDSIWELPNHWDNYDLPYFAFNYHPAFPSGQGRIANYTGVLNNWKDDFFGSYDYGLLYVLQLDPAAIGTPGRIGILDELLDYIKSFGDVWFATGSEVVDYWRNK